MAKAVIGRITVDLVAEVIFDEDDFDQTGDYDLVGNVPPTIELEIDVPGNPNETALTMLRKVVRDLESSNTEVVKVD